MDYYQKQPFVILYVLRGNITTQGEGGERLRG